MAKSTRLCHLCGQVFATPAARNEHVTTAHPGERITWRGRELVLIATDGTERKVGKRELQRMRRAVTDADAAPLPVPADDGPAPEPVREDAPPATGPRVREPARPSRAPRVTQAGGTPMPSRSSLAEAFPATVLAGIIRQLSVSISQMDGAGPAGELSAIEAAQIASLLHDATLDTILRYFSGNVDRFKVAMAVLIIALAKGRVHLTAIRRGQAARAEGRAAIEAREYAEAQAAEAAADVPEPAHDGLNGHVTPEPAPVVDPIAALAARQRASYAGAPAESRR